MTADRLTFDMHAQSGFPRRNFEFLNDIESIGAAFWIDDVDAESQIATIDRLPLELEHRFIFGAFGDFDFERARLHILRYRYLFRRVVE